jgi:hypothetical protein
MILGKSWSPAGLLPWFSSVSEFGGLIVAVEPADAEPSRVHSGLKVDGSPVPPCQDKIGKKFDYQKFR